MVESILEMKREVMNSLKRIGKVDLCLHSDKIELYVHCVDQVAELFEAISVIHRTATVSVVPLVIRWKFVRCVQKLVR